MFRDFFHFQAFNNEMGTIVFASSRRIEPYTLYSTQQKYSAPSMRRRGRVRVKISTWNFGNIFISHCHLAYV